MSISHTRAWEKLHVEGVKSCYRRADLLILTGQVQVGVVCKGVPFPFWMRGQAVLTLRVVTAAPDDVVRLAPGAEVSIAPRPRARKYQASNNPMSMPAVSGEKPSLLPAWFRIQVRLNLRPSIQQTDKSKCLDSPRKIQLRRFDACHKIDMKHMHAYLHLVRYDQRI